MRVQAHTGAPAWQQEGLQAEAALLEACEHANVVRCFGLRQREGELHPHLVLERMAGGSLEERIRCGCYPSSESGYIAHEHAGACYEIMGCRGRTLLMCYKPIIPLCLQHDNDTPPLHLLEHGM